MRPHGPPFLVGVGGAVAVGKSTFAQALKTELQRELGGREGTTVEVVATDGFLRPNDELAAEGLLAQKGFPDTYDRHAISSFLDALRQGRTATMPVYSHITYDREPGRELVVERGFDVVVLEGVNALQPEIAEHLDLKIFVDADEPLVRSWFVRRFLQLVDAAETDTSSFYARFADLDDVQRRQIADSVWTGVNLVNLTEHILPTRIVADLVLTKTAGHAFS